jgi:hypothetical protein
MFSFDRCAQGFFGPSIIKEQRHDFGNGSRGESPMRIIGSFILLAGLVVCASAVGQEGKWTPPRLHIATKTEGQDKSRVLKVESVSPGGLGQQLGLKPGDIFRSVRIEDKELPPIRTPQDLSRCLADIGQATLREKSVRVAVRILRGDPQTKKMTEQTISGIIFPSKFLDKVDGGTLYYFRSDKKSG